ncbi:MAG: hypothetical protein Q8K59_10945 [Nitrosomonas sp.]|nr:hypothetical protein [Nitrosomonas sp.]MDP1951589.1 hypothetical protein [Nitrosomonas sp.]
MTKRGKQASRKAAARKYGFLEVPYRHFLRMSLLIMYIISNTWSVICPFYAMFRLVLMRKNINFYLLFT